MLTPKPTQIVGARFLASRRTALLADLPRVGKTGTAILAADDLLASSILVVTTASGCGVWKAGFADWSPFERRLQVLGGGATLKADTEVVIVSWGVVSQPAVRAQLLKRTWDLLILDEAHAAKSFDTKRTQAVYGTLEKDGVFLNNRAALASKCERIWALTGTPIPNCPLDVYPMLRALCSERLAAQNDWPDATTFAAFTERYAKMRPMKVGRQSRWSKTVQVFMEGRNLAELRARMDGFFLQRTQRDVGILEPTYEVMPLGLAGGNGLKVALAEAVRGTDAARVLDAAERGDTKTLDLQLGPLRRLTGVIKAHAVVDAIGEELKYELERVVLAYWHKDVGEILREGFAKFGVSQIDGSTSTTQRTVEVSRFRGGASRVFLGQIQAAGEAIDLSASAHLVFVESSL